MSSEKSPPIYTEKSLFAQDYSKKKICSKSVISWVLAAVLVALIIILSIQFLYPVMEKRYSITSDNFHLFEENPIEVHVITPGNKKSKESSDEKTEKADKSSSSSESSKDKSKSKEKKHKPWHADFLINPSHLCATRMPAHSEKYQDDPELKLLMIVPSAADHFDQRTAIRKTWGSIADKPRGPMRLGFILGTTPNQAVEDMIKQESDEYGDIIQGDFEDTYRNLTVKSIVMLKWVAKYCSHAQYFLKADDDTFVNVGIIARLLGREPFLSQEKFIGGYVHEEAQPTRDPEEKYYVSEYEYPDDVYPPYASGSAYVTTGPTAVDLFEAAQKVEPILPMEDIFVTGLCAQEVEVTLIHEPRFRYDDPPRPATWDAYSNLATAHSVTADELLLLWNEMSQSILDHLYKQEAAINATVALRRK